MHIMKYIKTIIHFYLEKHIACMALYNCIIDGYGKRGALKESLNIALGLHKPQCTYEIH